MIRYYQPTDHAEVLRAFQAGDTISPSLIEDTLRRDKVWVYHDGSVKGCAVVSIPRNSEASECDVWIYTHPNEREKGIGSALWRVAERAANEFSPAVLYTEYRLDGNPSRAFFQSRGFQRQWAFQLLAYRQATPSKPMLDIRTYEDSDFPAYLAIRQSAFTALADAYGWSNEEATDSSRRQQMLREHADIFLLFEDGLPVGIGRIHRHYIDTIAVRPECQGRGYGRALVEHCLHELRARGVQEPGLVVATKNQSAIGLYQRLGFDLLQINERGMAEIGAAN